MKVLIIDDNRIETDTYYIILVDMLEKLKIKYNKSDIYLCHGYNEFTNIRNREFNLAIIDYVLNGAHSGEEVVNNINCNNIVIISAYKRIASRYAERKNILFLEKPIDVSILEKYIVEKFK